MKAFKIFLLLFIAFALMILFIIYKSEF